MASEVLSVPEEHLEEVIKVIRAGLLVADVRREVSQQLKKWCDEEQEYVERLRS